MRWRTECGPVLYRWTWTVLIIFILHQSSAAPIAEEEGQQAEVQEYGSGCYYNLQHYDEGDRIITNEPCLNCTCHNSMLMCYLRVCPFTKPIGQDCTIEKRADQCCPIIKCPEVPVQLLTSTTENAQITHHNHRNDSTAIGHVDDFGCHLDDVFYTDGAQLPTDSSNPCELCYCIRNRTACIMQECTLNVEGCRPIYAEGVCCPVRYDCDYDKATTTTTTEAPSPTPSLILTTTTGGPLDCKHNGYVYADGASIETEAACEHCYCMRGEIVCAVQDCGAPLDHQNCTAVPPPAGSCCPETYHCGAGISIGRDLSASSQYSEPDRSYSDNGTEVDSNGTSRQDRRHKIAANLTMEEDQQGEDLEGQSLINEVSPPNSEAPSSPSEPSSPIAPLTEADTPTITEESHILDSGVKSTTESEHSDDSTSHPGSLEASTLTASPTTTDVPNLIDSDVKATAESVHGESSTSNLSSLDSNTENIPVESSSTSTERGLEQTSSSFISSASSSIQTNEEKLEATTSVDIKTTTENIVIDHSSEHSFIPPATDVAKFPILNQNQPESNEENSLDGQPIGNKDDESNESVGDFTTDPSTQTSGDEKESSPESTESSENNQNKQTDNATEKNIDNELNYVTEQAEIQTKQTTEANKNSELDENTDFNDVNDVNAVNESEKSTETIESHESEVTTQINMINGAEQATETSENNQSEHITEISEPSQPELITEQTDNNQPDQSTRPSSGPSENIQPEHDTEENGTKPTLVGDQIDDHQEPLTETTEIGTKPTLVDDQQEPLRETTENAIKPTEAQEVTELISSLSPTKPENTGLDANANDELTTAVPKQDSEINEAATEVTILDLITEKLEVTEQSSTESSDFQESSSESNADSEKEPTTTPLGSSENDDKTESNLHERSTERESTEETFENSGETESASEVSSVENTEQGQSGTSQPNTLPNNDFDDDSVQNPNKKETSKTKPVPTESHDPVLTGVENEKPLVARPNKEDSSSTEKMVSGLEIIRDSPPKGTPTDDDLLTPIEVATPADFNVMKQTTEHLKEVFAMFSPTSESSLIDNPWLTETEEPDVTLAYVESTGIVTPEPEHKFGSFFHDVTSEHMNENEAHINEAVEPLFPLDTVPKPTDTDEPEDEKFAPFDEKGPLKPQKGQAETESPISSDRGSTLTDNNKNIITTTSKNTITMTNDEDNAYLVDNDNQINAKPSENDNKKPEGESNQDFADESESSSEEIMNVTEGIIHSGPPLEADSHLMESDGEDLQSTEKTTDVDEHSNEASENINNSGEVLSGIPGEGDCLVDNKTYRNNSDVPAAGHCQTSCRCVSSIVHCVLVTCPPPPDKTECSPRIQTNSCCPEYVCAENSSEPSEEDHQQTISPTGNEVDLNEENHEPIGSHVEVSPAPTSSSTEDTISNEVEEEGHLVTESKPKVDASTELPDHINEIETEKPDGGLISHSQVTESAVEEHEGSKVTMFEQTEHSTESVGNTEENVPSDENETSELPIPNEEQPKPTESEEVGLPTATEKAITESDIRQSTESNESNESSETTAPEPVETTEKKIPNHEDDQFVKITTETVISETATETELSTSKPTAGSGESDTSDNEENKLQSGEPMVTTEGELENVPETTEIINVHSTESTENAADNASSESSELLHNERPTETIDSVSGTESSSSFSTDKINESPMPEEVSPHVTDANIYTTESPESSEKITTELPTESDSSHSQENHTEDSNVAQEEESSVPSTDRTPQEFVTVTEAAEISTSPSVGVTDQSDEENELTAVTATKSVPSTESPDVTESSEPGGLSTETGIVSHDTESSQPTEKFPVRDEIPQVTETATYTESSESANVGSEVTEAAEENSTSNSGFQELSSESLPEDWDAQTEEAHNSSDHQHEIESTTFEAPLTEEIPHETESPESNVHDIEPLHPPVENQNAASEEPSTAHEESTTEVKTTSNESDFDDSSTISVEEGSETEPTVSENPYTESGETVSEASSTESHDEIEQGTESSNKEESSSGLSEGEHVTEAISITSQKYPEVTSESISDHDFVSATVESSTSSEEHDTTGSVQISESTTEHVEVSSSSVDHSDAGNTGSTPESEEGSSTESETQGTLSPLEPSEFPNSDEKLLTTESNEASTSTEHFNETSAKDILKPEEESSSTEQQELVTSDDLNNKGSENPATEIVPESSTIGEESSETSETGMGDNSDEESSSETGNEVTVTEISPEDITPSTEMHVSEVSVTESRPTETSSAVPDSTELGTSEMNEVTSEPGMSDVEISTELNKQTETTQKESDYSSEVTEADDAFSPSTTESNEATVSVGEEHKEVESTESNVPTEPVANEVTTVVSSESSEKSPVSEPQTPTTDATLHIEPVEQTSLPAEEAPTVTTVKTEEAEESESTEVPAHASTEQSVKESSTEKIEQAGNETSLDSEEHEEHSTAMPPPADSLVTQTTVNPEVTSKAPVEESFPVRGDATDKVTEKPEAGYDYTKPVTTEGQKPLKPVDHPFEEEDFPPNNEYLPTDDDYDTDDEQPYGPGTCRYAGKVYVSAQQIPRDDPCDFCFCFRSDIICLQQSCPPPIPGCHEEPIQGFCCPRYECHVRMATLLNVTTTTTTTTTTLPPHFFSHPYKGAVTKTGCMVQGKAYHVGQAITSSSGPCMDCICGGDGKMKCEPKVCSPEPMLRQMLNNSSSGRFR